MSAILNGILPARKKDHYVQDRNLNTRWGDAAISAPIHGGWNTNTSATTDPSESPDLDRDLPPTPPQHQDEESGVFIMHDEDGDDHSLFNEGTAASDRDNFTITIPLPWKKKQKIPSHVRKQSSNNAVTTKTIVARRLDVPTLLTGPTEAAAVPLPESRINSPIGRTNATSPVLSFKSRLCSPNLGDILSPVAEGFAKSGPSSRSGLSHSQTSYSEDELSERPPTASSMRSNAPHRLSMHSYNSDGIGFGTMSSQATVIQQAPEMQRPPSRGIGATAHMRASSRGPRANSRGPRAPSVEPFARRAPSMEPINHFDGPAYPDTVPMHSSVMNFEPMRRRAPSVEPPRRRAPSVEPRGRRAPSMEPYQRRSPPMEYVGRRAPSAEPVSRRAPSVEPAFRRAPSVEPTFRRAPSPERSSRRAPSPERSSRRAPSPERSTRRGPSAGPSSTRRVQSREPRGRQGQSIETVRRVRFHSEAPRTLRRSNSFSSNDGSVDSDDDRSELSEPEPSINFSLPDRDSRPTRKVRRRRSIASPISSPTAAGFGIIAPTPLALAMNSNSISMNAAMFNEVQQTTKRRSLPQDSLQSRPRGLYADMHDDFRRLARDVHMDTTATAAANAAPATVVNNPAVNATTSPALLQLTSTVVNPAVRSDSPALSQLPSHIGNPESRSASPALTSNPPTSFIGVGHPAALSLEAERNGYASDSSFTSFVPPHPRRRDHQADGLSSEAAQLIGARERKDQLRRDERRRAREKVARKLERDMEQAMATNLLSDNESVVSVPVSVNDYGRRFYAASVASDNEYGSVKDGRSEKKKVLVPNAEEIWG